MYDAIKGLGLNFVEPLKTVLFIFFLLGYLLENTMILVRVQDFNTLWSYEMRRYDYPF